MELDPEKMIKDIEQLKDIIADKIKEMKGSDDKASDEDGTVRYGEENFAEHDGRLISSKKISAFSVLKKPDEMKDDAFTNLIKERTKEILGG